MKLEFKHLYADAPYNVECVSCGYSGVLELINRKSNKIKVSCSEWWENTDKYKMKLRPLSDLTKDIREYLPSVALEDASEIVDAIETGDILYIRYDLINKLLERHFDIFELIDAGLAVDINSL